MRMQRITIFLGSLLLSLALISCGGPIAKVYRQAAVSASFSTVFQNPENFKGDTVVWGGSIIRTIPVKEGAVIYVLERQLGFKDKPKGSETSRGRFIARARRHLDPLVYSPGQKITVAGKVIGEKVVTNKKIGATYTYPVIQVEQLHLWPLPEAAAVSPYWGGWGWDGGWGYGNPYWGGPYFDNGFIHQNEGEEEEGGEFHEGGEVHSR